MSDAPRSYLLYVRQSLTPNPEESLSLAAQERALRDLVRHDGGVVLEPPIIDADQRGWDPARPGLAALMERIEREQPDAVAVYAVSRLARDAWLAEGLWRKAQQLRPGLVFRSVTEPHANDELVRGILGVISQAERKRMGAFLSSAFRERARQGKPHGRAPYGYRRGDDGRLVVDEDAADWIRRMISRLEAGWSLWRIANWLTASDAAGRRWEAHTVRDVLANPSLAGAVRVAEVTTWDAHEPIISRDHYERLTALLTTRRYIRTKTIASWLEGLMVCGCGAPMDLCHVKHVTRGEPFGNFRCGASIKSTGKRAHLPPCTARPRSITQAKAERLTIAALIDAFDGLQPAGDVLTRWAAEADAAAPDHARHHARLTRQRAKLDRERDRLLVLYRRGTLDVDRWESEDAALAAQLAAVDAELTAIPAPPDPATIRHQAAALADLGAHVRQVAAHDPAQLRNVLQDAGAVVVVTPDGVRIEWPGELRRFFNAAM